MKPKRTNSLLDGKERIRGTLLFGHILSSPGHLRNEVFENEVLKRAFGPKDKEIS
jgi:hypothetical protein